MKPSDSSAQPGKSRKAQGLGSSPPRAGPLTSRTSLSSPAEMGDHVGLMMTVQLTFTEHVLQARHCSKHCRLDSPFTITTYQLTFTNENSRSPGR